jgi:nucleoside-diphosphate-sugar epimerase
MPRSIRKALITGAAGFVGSALAMELLRRGIDVVCLDVADFWRLNGHTRTPGLELIHGDARDETLIARLVSQCDAVVHLAAVVGVGRYMDEPEAVLDTNILGTKAVARACLDAGRPLLFTSTSEVYGSSSDDVLEENGRRVLGRSDSSRWSYAISKIAAEEYVRALGRRGLRWAIVRYFNVYGPLQDRPGEGRIISKFIGELRAGRPLRLVDGGSAIRSFCYVDDAVAPTAAVLEGLARGNGITGRTVNVGRREPVTMRRLATLMNALSGRGDDVVEVSGAQEFGAGFEDMPRRIPDLSTMHKLLGLEAGIPLAEGLRRTLRHWGLLAGEAALPP